MSYAEEHNLNESENTNSNDNDTNDQNTNPILSSNSRNHPTLASFLNTPSNSGFNENTESRIQAFLNYIGGSREMLEMITSNNNVINYGGLKDSENKGVEDSFLDTLERVNVKTLKDDDTCPICTNDYKSDPYPLVVELPCNKNHRFDLDCIGPWLKLNRTCPLCRTDVTIKKNKIEIVDSEEEEEGWDMYG